MQLFKAALELDDKNLVAANNYAVCLLYVGRLQEATAFLEDTVLGLGSVHGTLLANLCTLYELESNRADEKKKALVPLVVRLGTDAFSIASLKISG